MRLPLVFKLSTHRGAVFRVEAVFGDTVRAERRYKADFASIVDDPLWLEPIVAMLHSRLGHLSARGVALECGSIDPTLDGFLERELEAVGMVGTDDATGVDVVQWIGAAGYEVQLFGTGEPGVVEALPWDTVRGERHYKKRAGELIRSSEAHGFLVHSALWRKATLEGTSVLPLPSFLEGSMPHSLEWLSVVDRESIEDMPAVIELGFGDSVGPFGQSGSSETPL